MPEEFIQKKKTIDLEPFPYCLHLIVTNDVPQAELLYRRSNGDPSPVTAGANTGALTLTSRDLQKLTVVMPFKCDIGVIAHEICHVVNKLFQFVGAKYEAEVWAYYQGWLVRETAKFCYKTSGLDKKVDKLEEALV